MLRNIILTLIACSLLSSSLMACTTHEVISESEESSVVEIIKNINNITVEPDIQEDFEESLEITIEKEIHEESQEDIVVDETVEYEKDSEELSPEPIIEESTTEEITTEPPQEHTEAPEIVETINTSTSDTKTPQPAPRPLETTVQFKDVKETIYATVGVNVRTGPGTSYGKIGVLNKNSSAVRTGTSEIGWSRITYNGIVGYVYDEYISTEKPVVQIVDTYPMVYEDSTAKITITKEWHGQAWCFIAHLKFSDYSRFSSAIAYDNRGSYETTSHLAQRIGAIFAVNGPYNWGEQKNTYAIIRNGVVYNDKPIRSDLSIYNNNNGILANADSLGLRNVMASDAAAQGLATDTFKFWNSEVVKNGEILVEQDYNRAQRTFIGTNENAGDIYVIVTEGRKVDGESYGMTIYNCAKLMHDLGCTYGVMLDGGGSSTMYFNGKVLNSAKNNQRAVVDFVYFK